MTNQDSTEVSRSKVLQALPAMFIYSNNICNSLGGFEKQHDTFSQLYHSDFSVENELKNEEIPASTLSQYKPCST